MTHEEAHVNEAVARAFGRTDPSATPWRAGLSGSAARTLAAQEDQYAALVSSRRGIPLSEARSHVVSTLRDAWFTVAESGDRRAAVRTRLDTAIRSLQRKRPITGLPAGHSSDATMSEADVNAAVLRAFGREPRPHPTGQPSPVVVSEADVDAAVGRAFGRKPRTAKRPAKRSITAVVSEADVDAAVARAFGRNPRGAR